MGTLSEQVAALEAEVARLKAVLDSERLVSHNLRVDRDAARTNYHCAEVDVRALKSEVARLQEFTPLPVAKRRCDCEGDYYLAVNTEGYLHEFGKDFVRNVRARSATCSICGVTVSVDAPEEQAEEPVIRWGPHPAHPQAWKGAWGKSGFAYAYPLTSWAVYGPSTPHCCHNALASGDECGEAAQRAAEAFVRQYLADHPE